MAIQPDYSNAGVAGIQNEDVNGAVELFAGDTPAPVSISAAVPSAVATAGLAAFTPVVVDNETGTLALVDGTTETKANAVTIVPVAAGSAVGSVPVYKAGCFNINALQWPATFDTEAKKLAAFNLGECQIYVKKPYYA